MAETKKKFGLILTAWLVLMLILNAFSAIIYLLLGSLITVILPAIHSWAVYLLGILSLINIVIVIFLFKWKKWAFFATCGMTGIAFVLNVFLIGVGIASILGLLGPVILWLLLRSKWKYLE